MLQMTALEKEQRLIQQLKETNKLAIAYSGGVASSYLLHTSLNVLGPRNILAIVMNSELISDEEFNEALDLAEAMGANVLGLEMSELSQPKIATNTSVSLYYSKKMLYQTIHAAAVEEGFPVLADGMIMDNKEDFQLGLKARDEEGIISFLQEADLYEEDVRQLAKEAGLSNWNRNSLWSLANRFPRGKKLTLSDIEKVFEGEKYLREIGFPIVRLHSENEEARIEVPEQHLLPLVEKKEAIIAHIKQLGFSHVSIDLEGFHYERESKKRTIQRKTIS